MLIILIISGFVIGYIVHKKASYNEITSWLCSIVFFPSIFTYPLNMMAFIEGNPKWMDWHGLLLNPTIWVLGYEIWLKALKRLYNRL